MLMAHDVNNKFNDSMYYHYSTLDKYEIIMKT